MSDGKETMTEARETALALHSIVNEKSAEIANILLGKGFEKVTVSFHTLNRDEISGKDLGNYVHIDVQGSVRL
jgi:hypothetical protein